MSDSVRNASRLMLLFLPTRCRASFQRVRSFAFVSDLSELTPHFRGVSARAEALEQALSGGAINLSANSNYGSSPDALRKGLSWDGHAQDDSLRNRGDGRNNHNPANAWALRDIRLRARRLGSGSPPSLRRTGALWDSEMYAYERECSQTVVAVTDLAQLAEFAESFVPR